MKSITRNHGAALVITLAMIVMLTFLLVAFLSRSIANVQVGSASTGAARADMLAKSAGGVIVSDLKSEMIAGSLASGSSSQAPVYLPRTPVAAVPAVSRYAFSATDAPTFVNLVKQSTGRFYPDAAPYTDPAANTKCNPIIQTVTEFTTDTISPNGRAVIAKRWDNAANTAAPSGPLLLVTPSTTTVTDSRFTNNAMLPHWVMMTRQGVPATQTWTTDWKNYSPDNPNAAIGRFAYNIYNTGGLLDVNVAGFQENSTSSALTVTAVGQKGTLGLSKLSLIPGMGSSPANNATTFVNTWRNLASSSTADNYLGYLGFTKDGSVDLSTTPFFMTGPRTGFLKPANNASAADNRLLGRQDLIRLATKSSGSSSPYGLSVASLPYLTHYTRELNAPSWSPTANAATLGAGGNNGTPISPAPAPYAYLDNRDNPLIANRFLPNVRVATGATWRRLTGDKAVDGEPLIKYRFPLSWLAILQDSDPSTTDWELTPEATNIITALDLRSLANGGTGLGGATSGEKAAWLVQRAFGLAWDKANYRWVYTGSPTTPTAAVPLVAATSIELLGDASSSGSAVSRETREPNFFELLKAGILSGSLGNSSDYENMCQNIGEDANPDNQVMQIGANMIDQVDTDSYPTRIAFGTRMDCPPSLISPKTASNAPVSTGEVKVFAGVEDVPYIHSFLSTPYRVPAGTSNVYPPTDPNSLTQNAQLNTIDGWLQFVIWKPQQLATSTAGPTNFRILFTGTNIHLTYFGPPVSPTEFPPGSGVTYGYRDTEPFLPNQANVTFSDLPQYFRVPTLLGGMDVLSAHGFTASQPEGSGTNPHGGAQLPRGMWLGETYRPERIYTAGSPNNTAPTTQHTEFRCYEDSRMELQFRDGTGQWRTFQRYDRFGVATGKYIRGRGLYGYADDPFGQGNAGSPVLYNNTYPAFAYLDIATQAISNADPRTQRFGLMAHFLDEPAPSYPTPAMLVPTGTASPKNWKYFLKEGWAPKISTPYSLTFGPCSSNGRFTPNWTTGNLQNPWQGKTAATSILDPTKFWADNATSTASTYSYRDMDLIQRRADGDSTYSVRPVQQPSYGVANTQDLGRVLNRPFRSVGELGYVLRDEPYKTLNLLTPASADGALLDLFSVNEQPAIIAGKVNLNTQNPEVLQAVITGAVREEASTSNIINSTDALTIAQKLVANTSTYTGVNTGPLLNPAEIANRLPTILPFPSSTTSPDANLTIKTRREMVGRALAGSGQTRTWNLLVDVIAQSGRFAPSAGNSSQFVVEGEKRYWMHIAIDRFTGQVVDQQLEPVME